LAELMILNFQSTKLANINFAFVEHEILTSS